MMEPEPQKPVWCERKQAAVQEELKRMIHLPPNSSYVSHRRKVLNKILELMSIQVLTPFFIISFLLFQNKVFVSKQVLFCYVRELYLRTKSWNCFLLVSRCERIIINSNGKFCEN